VVALLSGGYAWWAAVLRPFTLPALAAVLTGGLAALAFGRALPSGRTPSPAGLPRSEVWVGLAAALGLWELASFLHHSRADHPTLSSLINTLFQSHPTRAIGLLAWLAVGAGLARR
jgi:hypothetical protein